MVRAEKEPQLRFVVLHRKLGASVNIGSGYSRKEHHTMNQKTNESKLGVGLNGRDLCNCEKL